MSDMEQFRQQMFQNAAIHGGVASDNNMLTKQSIDMTQKAEEFNSKIQAVINNAVSKGTLKADDKLFNHLWEKFQHQGTAQGKAQALRFVIMVCQRIHEKFEVTEK